ncbi:MAG: type IV pilin protein [Bdellovibrionales bacterium]
MRWNSKGFSLIELMSVVAIIGTLAVIAVPNYQRFSRNATHKEGKALLSTFYGNMRITYSQMGQFPGDFVAIGFSPEGQVNYRLKMDLAPRALIEISYPPNWVCDRSCFSTEATACNVHAAYPSLPASALENTDPRCETNQTIGEDGATVVLDTGGVAYNKWEETPLALEPPAELCTAITTENIFQACAAADLGANLPDVMMINHAKVMRHIQDGR